MTTFSVTSLHHISLLAPPGKYDGSICATTAMLAVANITVATCLYFGYGYGRSTRVTIATIYYLFITPEDSINIQDTSTGTKYSTDVTHNTRKENLT